MRISTETLEVFKNYSNINSNLWVPAGNVIRTVSPAKNIVGEAKVSESFPVDFGIYNMQQFLSVMSLLKDADLSFGERSLTMSDGRVRVNYVYADRNLLTVPPAKVDFDKFPTADVSFTLSTDDLNELAKAGAILGANVVSVENQGGSLVLRLVDKDAEGNSYAVEPQNASFNENDSFRLILTLNTLRFIDGVYNVKISRQKFSLFTHQDRDIRYLVSLDVDSSYEGNG